MPGKTTHHNRNYRKMTDLMGKEDEFILVLN